jgi:DNA polymerase-4
MSAAPRAILHVDMDAFFASVEQLDDPSLRGKPVLVGGDGPRGVVMAASYEAREFGCHSAQPMAIAKRKCPDAIIVRGSGSRYREVSQQVFAIFETVTPLVQPLSIDEAFLDVTGSVRLFGPPVEIARLIRRRIREETGITASVGVAPNKFLAKLVSEWDKPDGLTVIEPGEVIERLAPLPVKAMWGVGPAMEKRLHALGLRTFGDLQKLTPEGAKGLLGDQGEHFRRLSLGLDKRTVTPDSSSRSISSEQTFGADIGDPDFVRGVLLGQCEQVAWRLRKHDLRGRTVQIKVRYGDFETITRSETLETASDSTEILWRAGGGLFDRWRDKGFRPVRLIGFGASNIVGGADRDDQMTLFIDDRAERAKRVDVATDAVVERFGLRSIHRGVRPRAGGAGKSGGGNS